MAGPGLKLSVTRFAPSPTGRLHLGHGFSALTAWDAAQDELRNQRGRFLLRIEDIDGGRSKPEFEAGIIEDLIWLGEGLANWGWEEPVRRQSDHMEDYAAALSRLMEMGVLYPCFCTRGDIRAEIERAGAAPHRGEEGPIYPGLCRGIEKTAAQDRIDAGEAHALRLDVARACEITGPLTWRDMEKGEVMAEARLHGDVVLARKDVKTSYHLAVTVDDHIQGVNLVTRGDDLFVATHVHRLLQALLGFDTPTYFHHHLLTDKAGKRLAKRDKSITLKELRDSGRTPAEVRAMTGFKEGGVVDES